MQNLLSLFSDDKESSFSASSTFALFTVFQHSRQWSALRELRMEGNPSLPQRSHLYRFVFRFMSWYRIGSPFPSHFFLWRSFQGPCHISRLCSWYRPRSGCSWSLWLCSAQTQAHRFSWCPQRSLWSLHGYNLPSRPTFMFPNCFHLSLDKPKFPLIFAGKFYTIKIKKRD